MNFPLSRGTATAFPLAAFGLSAFLFGTIGTFAFKDDTSKLLVLLGIGTCLLPVVSFPFLRVYSRGIYDHARLRESLASSESRALDRSRSSESRKRLLSRPSHSIPSGPVILLSPPEEDLKDQLDEDDPSFDHEGASLVSKPSHPEMGDAHAPEISDGVFSDHYLAKLNLRGLALLPHPEFWQLFLMMGLMTGVGLMTIK